MLFQKRKIKGGQHWRITYSTWLWYPDVHNILRTEHAFDINIQSDSLVSEEIDEVNKLFVEHYYFEDSA